MEWGYKSYTPSSSGYEDVLEHLKPYNRDIFLGMDDDEKESTINKIFDVYRGKNILPITYYNEEGIKAEIRKCIDKYVSFDDDVLNLKFVQGNNLCRFMFPNLSDICVAGDQRTILRKFNSDHNLKRAIEFCLKHKKSKCPVTPSGIKDGLEMLGGNVATNFKPMNAKALYERYTPKGGVVFDFACGFGGRMLGCLSSKNEYKYFGVEPNTETFNNLIRLGNSIEAVTGRTNSYKVVCMGSEDMTNATKGCVDFAFSSPPYFDLEHYCDEDTQCYIKFPTLESWFGGYVTPTIKNLHTMLKTGGKYAVNIADFKVGKKQVNFVDEWIKISEAVGFEFVEQIHMKLQNRRGVGHGSNARDKKEGIFVFIKK